MAAFPPPSYPLLIFLLPAQSLKGGWGGVRSCISLATAEYPAHVARISDVVAVFAAIAIALSAQKLNLRLWSTRFAHTCEALFASFNIFWLNLNFKHLPVNKGGERSWVLALFEFN